MIRPVTISHKKSLWNRLIFLATALIGFNPIEVDLNLTAPLYRTVEYEGSFPPNLEGHVTNFAPHKALQLIAWGKLTFDERFVIQRVVHTI